MAEETIRQTVSLFKRDCPKTRPHLSPKMSEYYERETATADAEPTPSPARTGDQGEPSYMSLPSKYGLDDMEIGIGIGVGVGNLGQNKRTIEQEYQAYVTPPFSVQSSDPLKFWEVGGGINGG